MTDACIKAIELNIKELAFTDHVDLDWPDNVFPPFNPDTLERYFDDLASVKNKFANLVKIKFGVEIGMQPHTLETCSKLISKYPFDFVIASTHIVNRQDPSLPEYFDGKTKEESYIRYYEEILNLITDFDTFCVLGHLDYIKRYSPFTYVNNDHLIGIDIIDEILKTLIRKNKGIEVNTSGYRHISNMPMPHFDIVERYKALGGQIITMGSDAHFTKYIGLNFKETFAKLKSLGFENVTLFEKMKPQVMVSY